MDNFDNNNNIGGFEPQKPFTERPVTDSKDNQPMPNENQGVSNPQNIPQNSEPTVPNTNFEEVPENYAGGQVQNNAPDNDYVFSDNRFGSTPERPVQTGNMPEQNMYGQNTYGQNTYAQNTYGQPQQMPPQNTQQFGTPGMQRQNYNAQYQQYLNNRGQNPNVPPQAPYPQFTNQPNPKKMNKGVIALIIVLCSLLVISLAGLAVYVFSVGFGKAVDRIADHNDNNKSYSFTLPDEDSTTPFSTLPNSDNQSQSKEHSESDYSSKTNSNYSGLKLESKPKDAKTNDDYTAASASEKVSDSVVGILCYSDDAPDKADTTTASSQGSGIIISSDGYLITNAHVIGNSKTAYAIRVVTSDGKEYKAGVVGYDSRTDIAVLKMDDAKNLTAANFGKSSELEVGQDIIVVGNPGGLDYQNTTTKGVISALDRKLSSSSLTKYIQTDAAINPGNSGGPLVNYYGQVIGITTSKIVSETYEGMGFAIPSDTVKNIVDTLVKNGYVEGRVKIGITGIAVSAEQSSSYGIPQGIYVQSISEGGPCDGTELAQGDVITEADGTKVTSFANMYAVLETHKPGDKIKLKYYNTSSDSEKEIEITLQEDK